MAIIDTSKPRRQWFETPSGAHILRENADIRPSVYEDLTDLEPAVENGRLVVLTEEGSLAQIQRGRYTLLGDEALDRAVEGLGEGQVGLLPPSERKPQAEARRVMNVYEETLADIFHPDVKRLVLGQEKLPPGPVTPSRVEEWGYYPERALAATVQAVSAGGVDVGDEWVGYRFGSNVATWSQVIGGSEQRSHQVVTAMAVLPPIIDWEIKREKDARTGEHLTAEQIGRRDRKRRRIREQRDALKQRGVLSDTLLERLAEHPDDMIEARRAYWRRGEGGHPDHVSKMWFRLSSLSDPSRKYELAILNPPATHPADARKQLRLVYGVSVESTVPIEFFWGHGRAEHLKHLTRPFCASLLTLHKILRERRSLRVNILAEKTEERVDASMDLLPIFVPRKGLSEYRHKLEHQTVVVAYDRVRERWDVRSLNQAERDIQLGRRVRARPFTRNASTDPVYIHHRYGENPLEYVNEYRT